MPYATIQRDYGQELIDALFGENATPEDMIYTVMASRLIWDNIHETATLIANEIDPTQSIPDLADNLAIGMVNSPDYLGVLEEYYALSNSPVPSEPQQAEEHQEQIEEKEADLSDVAAGIAEQVVGAGNPVVEDTIRQKTLDVIGQHASDIYANDNVPKEVLDHVDDVIKNARAVKMGFIPLDILINIPQVMGAEDPLSESIIQGLISLGGGAVTGAGLAIMLAGGSNPFTLGGGLLVVTTGAVASDPAAREMYDRVVEPALEGLKRGIEVLGDQLNQASMTNYDLTTITHEEAEAIKQNISNAAGAVKEKANEVWDALARFVGQTIDNARKFFSDLGDWIGEGLAALWDEIKWVFSPLVLDLDADGVELSSMENANIYWDGDQDNFAEQSGWVTGDDGFLAIDLNDDGVIDVANDNARCVILKVA